jgi:Flp pilus assembly pilin Flp
MKKGDPMTRVLLAIQRFANQDDGQSLVEYGMLAVLIALFVVGIVGQVGNVINMVLWVPIVQNF